MEIITLLYDKMQRMEMIFIITFGIYAISLGMQMLLSYMLFKSLKKDHLVYYKSIGEPIVVMLARLRDTEDEIFRNYIRGLKGAAFGYRMIFRGISKRFPADTRARKLAWAIRIITTITVISFTAFIVIGYFFYQYTL